MTESAAASHPWAGTLCGLGSAVGYTAANACLRAVADCDAIWVSTMKALPMVVCLTPWLAFLAWRGRDGWPAPRVLGLLAAAALIGQLGGNVLFQWSLGVVGIALAVPLCLGTIILGGAILGRVYLGEPLTLRTMGSVVVLVVALTVLSLGARDAQQSVAAYFGSAAAPPTWWTMAAGVAAAALSGLAYAVLGVVIRYGVTGRASLSWTMFIVGIVGVASLGSVTLARIGWQGIRDTAADDFFVMVLAGVFNFVAFIALTRAFQLASVVYVNAVNATQATMAAIAGVLFFREALSSELAIGVVLTIAGLMIMKADPPRVGREDA